MFHGFIDFGLKRNIVEGLFDGLLAKRELRSEDKHHHPCRYGDVPGSQGQVKFMGST